MTAPLLERRALISDRQARTTKNKAIGITAIVADPEVLA